MNRKEIDMGGGKERSFKYSRTKEIMNAGSFLNQNKIQREREDVTPILYFPGPE